MKIDKSMGYIGELLKQKGKVKWFNEKNGFGFIVQEDGKDLFFHFSGIAHKDYVAAEGDNVTYKVAKGKKGPKAICIKNVI